MSIGGGGVSTRQGTGRTRTRRRTRTERRGRNTTMWRRMSRGQVSMGTDAVSGAIYSHGMREKVGGGVRENRTLD